MVATDGSNLMVTSMNETECGLMDLDARQHTDDHTTLADTTPFVTEDHTYNQPIQANPPKKASAYIL